MIRLIFSLFICLAAITQADPVSLTFTNGNVLPGTPLKYEATKLDWTSNILAKPTTLDTSELLFWRKNLSIPPLPSNHTAQLELNKGGQILGILNELTNDHVTLDTSYMGLITVPRSMIRTLNIIEEKKTLYLGPGLLSDWILHDEHSWKNDSDGIISERSGSVSRKVDFPHDRFRIKFKIKWKNAPNFHLYFLTEDHTKNNSTSNFFLSLNRNRANLTKNYVDQAGEYHSTVLQPLERIQRFNGLEDVVFELFVNRQDGSFRLYANDILFGRWFDPDHKSGIFGEGLQLTSEGSYIGVTHISVSEWDGTIPVNSRPRSFSPLLSDKESAEGYQIIHLRNGDFIAAKVKGIEKSIAIVETPFAEIEIPLSRMKTVALRPLKESEYDEAIRMKGDVTGYFPNGMQLTFRLDSFQDMKAKIYSQNFGNTEIDLSVFSRIDFNIYQERFRMLR